MQLTGGNTSATLAYTVGNFKYNPIDPIDTGMSFMSFEF